MSKLEDYKPEYSELNNLLDLLLTSLSLLNHQVEQLKLRISQLENLITGRPELDEFPARGELSNLLASLKAWVESHGFSGEDREVSELQARLQRLLDISGSCTQIPQRSYKILVIEDDPLTSRLISHYLKDLKTEIIAFNEAEAALDYLKRELPDLVLLDLILPGMDGFQLLSQIKKNPEWQKIPVIMMSSVSGEKEIIKALEMGASDYLTKPFSPRIVSAKVRHYLNMT
ncbi:MAG: response regulator [Candidatus Aminicenantes bacterium]|nr:response regulator [Candidatus Aminicenantes bacterium]